MRVKILELHEVRVEIMDKGTESQAIPPACCKVCHLKKEQGWQHSLKQILTIHTNIGK